MPFLKFPKIFMPQKCWLKEKLTIWFLYRFSVNRSKRDLPRLLACDVGHHQRSRRMRRRAWSNEAMPAILPRWCWYLEEKLTKNNQKNAGDDCWVVGLFGWFVGWLGGWLVVWVVVVGWKVQPLSRHVFDGRNPAPPWMYRTLRKLVYFIYILHMIICTCQCQVVQQSAVVHIRTRKGMVLCPGPLLLPFSNRSGK